MSVMEFRRRGLRNLGSIEIVRRRSLKGIKLVQDFVLWLFSSAHWHSGMVSFFGGRLNIFVSFQDRVPGIIL
jgi:hypothetical protein